MDELDDWVIPEIPPSYKNPQVTSTDIVWNVWKGKWKSGVYPKTWGKIDVLLKHNPTELHRFYETHIWISSRGLYKQDPIRVPVCIAVKDDYNMSLYANHDGYEVVATGNIQDQVIAGKYTCKSVCDSGTIKLKIDK